MGLIEIWFFVLGIFLIVYVILDGFDLGGAIASLFLSKNDNERRIILNAIGRVWDGNEVWLLSFGVFLFGMFPMAYARFFSAAYIPVMLLAFSLILRAVAFEFRSQVESNIWRKTWDWILGISSTLIAVILSVAGANILKGVSMTEEPFRLHLFDALNPFALLSAITTLSFLILHSLAYLSNKTEGELYNKVIKLSKVFWISSLVLLLVWIVFSSIFEKQVFYNFIKYPLFTIAPIIVVLSFLLVMFFINKGSTKKIFIFSSATLASIILSFGFAMYPNLIKSSIDEKYNITIYKAASGELTLTIGLVIALIGIALVALYQSYVYKVFAGKIKIEDIHY
ncbi:MAG: cytochrome d ubiquinol oxidase subunit II [Brevinematales bacterium]|nr:cytochrome d ubiquinol oxidase subunit II [Brevinematales bacterium]